MNPIVMILLLCLTSLASAQTNTDIPSSETTSFHEQNNRFFVDLQISTSVISQSQTSIQLGWVVRNGHRVSIAYGLSNTVSSEDGTQRSASDDDSTPRDILFDDSEGNSQSLSLGYQHNLKSFENLKIWSGVSIGIANFDAEAKSSRRDYADDVAGYTINTSKITSESNASSLGINLDAEYFLAKDLTIGYLFELSFTNTTTKSLQESLSRQFVDDVAVGIEDPTVTDSDETTKSLATQMNGLYLRYYF